MEVKGRGKEKGRGEKKATRDVFGILYMAIPGEETGANICTKEGLTTKKKTV